MIYDSATVNSSAAETYSTSTARVVLPGGGHLVNLSQVAAYNDAVLRFLAAVEQGASGARR